jgi:hypothetical protein
MALLREGLEDVWLVSLWVRLSKLLGGRASGLSVCLMDIPFSYFSYCILVLQFSVYQI